MLKKSNFPFFIFKILAMEKESKINICILKKTSLYCKDGLPQVAGMALVELTGMVGQVWFSWNGTSEVYHFSPSCKIQ